jgi:hypothetical protein
MPDSQGLICFFGCRPATGPLCLHHQQHPPPSRCFRSTVLWNASKARRYARTSHRTSHNSCCVMGRTQQHGSPTEAASWTQQLKSRYG